METGSWSNPRSSSSPRRRTRSDKYCEARGEDEAVERELRAEYTCPFCAEDFDVVGLCCHMDEEHPSAVKSGVCPVCTERVGEEMVVHITMQHGNVFKISSKVSPCQYCISKTLDCGSLGHMHAIGECPGIIGSPHWL